MFKLKFYEKTADDKWRKIGELQHPSNDPGVVLDNGSKALAKVDGKRVGRVVIERIVDTVAAGEFALAAPKVEKKKK